MIEPNHLQISIKRQCELTGLSRSSWYNPVVGVPNRVSEMDALCMRLIDEEYTKRPFYGSRKMRSYLSEELKQPINRKRVQRLMRLMGIAGVAPGPNTSKPHPEHKIYPYLLRGLSIVRPNQVWSTDITFIPMDSGYMYLVAIIDWYSRYVLSWELSNTMDTNFCLQCLDNALLQATPEIFNTDQGAQFTSKLFTQKLLDAEIKISMDGRGRALDNIFVERLWRSVKYENIYMNDYQTIRQLQQGLEIYFDFYNHQRYHQSLGNLKPVDVHFSQCH